MTVKTSKTGEYLQIPIFPLLRGVLEKALAEPSTRAPHYVFQKLEAHYRINPDHLTDRVRRVMRASGFFDAEDARTEEEKKTSRGEMKTLRWVKPKHVVDIEIVEWTANGHLRHAAYRGLRPDKSAKDVIRESPAVHSGTGKS